jgi:hypothetical protein
MNRKKQLIISGFTIFFLLTQNLSFSQDANLTYLSNNFNITVPPIKPKQSPSAYYTYFMETGNGGYYRGTISDGFSIPPITVPYAYYIAPGSKAVLTLSAYYDTIRRPPRDIAIPVSNSITTQAPYQPNLSVYDNIRIDPCVTTVVPGDTMIVAVNYKPFTPISSSSKNIVAFFYNKQALSAGNIFNIINENTPLYNFNGTQISPFRRHNDEIFSSSIPSNIPDAVKESLRIAGAGYTNALYFQVPKSTTEKNIFITLSPDNNPAHYNTDLMNTGLTATIIQYDGTTVISKQSKSQLLDIKLYARDPNGIKTYPHCLDSFPSLVNKPIKYIVDFQNDGYGPARHVELIVSIPEGIKLPTDFLNITSTISQVNIQFKKWSILNPDEKYTYELKHKGAIQLIIFRMNKISLAGAPDDISLRHGTILFTLNTVSDRTKIDQCMYSDLSIVFTSLVRGGELKNPAIKKYDIISKNCKHIPSSYIPCPKKH